MTNNDRKMEGGLNSEQQQKELMHANGEEEEEKSCNCVHDNR